jgi:DNA-binding NarL/FixJ family response regulator
MLSEQVAATTVVIDSDEVVIEGLRPLFQSGGDVAIIGVPGNGTVGLRIMREGQPDVLLLDLGAADDDIAVLRSGSEEQLAEVVRQFAEGGDREDDLPAARPAPPQPPPDPAPHYQLAPEIELLVSTLSPRERDVLELVTAGYSNRRIADTCLLSMHTVRTHVQSILVKLGVHSKLEAAIFALRYRLVTAAAQE